MRAAISRTPTSCDAPPVNTTRAPRCPATAAHIIPAAPAPITATSHRIMIAAPPLSMLENRAF
jgi:hypothetical protein